MAVYALRATTEVVNRANLRSVLPDRFHLCFRRYFGEIDYIFTPLPRTVPPNEDELRRYLDEEFGEKNYTLLNIEKALDEQASQKARVGAEKISNVKQLLTTFTKPTALNAVRAVLADFLGEELEVVLDYDLSRVHAGGVLEQADDGSYRFRGLKSTHENIDLKIACLRDLEYSDREAEKVELFKL